MNYYVETNFHDHDRLRTSGGKGRDDYFEMLRRTGLTCIEIPVLKRERTVSAADRIRLELRLPAVWNKALKGIGEGDTLFVHNPPSEKFVLFHRVLRKVQRRGCRIVVIVFDLEAFLTPYYRKSAGLKDYLSRRTERKLFETADAMTVHNDRMKEKIAGTGIDPGKMVSVGVMDYLRDEEIDVREVRAKRGADKPAVFCGNLVPGKADFLREIPEDLPLNVYGPGFTAKDRTNITYRGVCPSIELMDVMEGSFGLVWDGDSARTGAGVCGEYLRCNNPHKIALYLASGIPVVVWDESAMAEFVQAEHCGLAVSSLYELPGMLSEMTESEYEELFLNAVRVGAQMRRGAHLQKAFEQVLELPQIPPAERK